MEDNTMKKQYIAPQMETYYIQSADSLLTTSNLVPVDGGGGINTLLKELGM